MCGGAGVTEGLVFPGLGQYNLPTFYRGLQRPLFCYTCRGLQRLLELNTPEGEE